MHGIIKTDKTHKCGYVAVVGLPNAGKSTLMNSLLGEKVTIVTDKPQTTRNNVTCILSAEDYQIIFIDTPGILRPRYKMQEVMASFIRNAVQESDAVLFLVDVSEFRGDYPKTVIEILERVKDKKIFVALNKIDLVRKESLLPVIQKTSETFTGSEIYPVSALNGEGTKELLNGLISVLPEGPKLYPEDILSNEPERFFVAELIREAVFLLTEQEIPYSTAVIIEKFEDKDDITVVHASIMVEKKSQKPILIGKNGRMIKKIGTKAREAVEEFLGRKIYLDLFIKVREDWRDKDIFLREAGLIFRK